MPNSLFLMQDEVTSLGGGTAYHWKINDVGSTWVEEFQGEDADYHEGPTGPERWTTGVNNVWDAADLYTSGEHNRYGVIYNTEVFAVGTGDFSVAAWIYLDNVEREHRMVCYYGTSYGITNSWGFDIRPTDWEIYLEDFESISRIYSNTHGISIGTWTHVAVTVDRSEADAKFYRNGILINDATVSNEPLDVQGVSTHEWYMGSIGSSSLFGNMNDLWFVKGYVLTANEIMQIYKFQGD